MAFLEIIPVTLSELNLLRNLSINTFIETFGAQNSEANIQHYLASQMSVTQLKKELQSANSDFYFAYFNDTLVGYLKLNYPLVKLEKTEKEKTFEIQRIYLLKAFQRRGFGKELFEKAVTVGKSKGYKKLTLGVWEHNTPALAFYKKLGLTIFDQHIFLLGSDPQTDLLLQLEI